MTDTNLQAVLDRLDALQTQVAFLVEKQKKQEELIDEMVMPVAKEALKSLTGTFADAEKKGYFAFGQELLKIGQRIVETYSVEDVRALGDSVTTILDTVKAVTQPDVLSLASEATEVLHEADKTEPIGLMGVMRATRNDDVGRGLAVMVEVLRKVGKGAAAAAKQPKVTSSRDKVNALLAPRRRPVKAERPMLASGNGASKRVQVAAPACDTGPSAPGPVIEGVAFTADGQLADPATWTSGIAEKIAAVEGVHLTDSHWKVVEFARRDYADRKSSPNIRRITQGMGVDTKSLYALFPKAPARTIAKIAGIPKPAGCL